ncbi:MAG TPA: methyltransferase domain-containing protein [Pseudonocardiaceae bacterium]|nr:methyltransferase domain-containing protein [Pseudonocardiaceae bacterium]
MAVQVDSWAGAENARRYAEFARTRATYRETSRDVVDLARPAARATVVDLACGTGITTEAVLSVLDRRGRVVAVDASAAMLTADRSFIHDDRVRWLHSPAERLGVDTVAGVDAVVRNSAISQTDVARTATAVRRVLRPGGRFVFNVGAAMLADHAGTPEPDPLADAMKEIAAQEHGWRPPPPDANRRQLSETSLRQVLHQAGFGVDRVEHRICQTTVAEQHAWLSVPVFTTNLFGGLPYDQRMAVLDKAYRRLATDHPQPVATRWVLFVATSNAA